MNTRNNDKPHFNIADVIIIVAIVAVVAALALRIYNVFGAKDSTTMVEIEFETEFETDERVSFDEGEKLYLAADNTYAGTITDYHSENTFKYAYNEKGELVGTYAGADVVYGTDPNHVGSEAYETLYPRGYTWLKNVRTYDSIENNFAVEYKVKDWNKVLPTKRDIRLRLTMVNDAPLDEVTFVTGEAPKTAKNTNIGELEYLLVRTLKYSALNKPNAL